MDKEDIMLFGAIVQVSALSDHEWVDIIRTAKEEQSMNKERCFEKGTEILKEANVLKN